MGSGKIQKFPKTGLVVSANLVFLSSIFYPGSCEHNIHVWQKENHKTAHCCGAETIPLVMVKAERERLTQYCGARGAI